VPKIEDPVHVIYKLCSAFFFEFCANSVHFFREELIQIYKHFAFTLNDIRLNQKSFPIMKNVGVYQYCTGQALEG